MANGAHLILMHHAHVLQGVQLTSDGRMCCYNLGNFMYDWEEGNVIVPVVVQEQNQSAISFSISTAKALRRQQHFQFGSMKTVQFAGEQANVAVEF